MFVIDYVVRLAPEETSVELTGFEHNRVTCVGMKTDIPVNTCFFHLFTMYLMPFGVGIVFCGLVVPELFLLDMSLKIPCLCICRLKIVKPIN